eukprot:GILJ01003381.1.p1 GENE.GILJ01003381.1~~GILJ01003381.1.p1  ORF type:complete len:532 (-),score=62.51 GILJ01003381.1:178-1773(-)
MFSTPVSQSVEKASSELLIGPDWQLNLDVCDIIKARPEGCKEGVKAIKKRLKNKNPKVQLLTLTVLETAMQNCGPQFHAAVGNKEFMGELVNITKKTDVNRSVEERILGLIQTWAETFSNQRHQYPLFVETYDTLKRKGVNFPDRDPRSAPPILTPASRERVGSNRSSNRSSQEFVPYDPTPSPLPAEQQLRYGSPGPRGSVSGSDKLRGDLAVVRSNIELTNEMINACSSAAECQDNDLLRELVGTLKAMEGRLMSLIGDLTDEMMMAECLQLNDDLHKSLQYYQDVCSGVAAVGSYHPAPAASGAAPLTVDLIGLDVSPHRPSAIPPSRRDDDVSRLQMAFADSNLLNSDDDSDLALRRPAGGNQNYSRPVDTGAYHTSSLYDAIPVPAPVYNDVSSYGDLAFTSSTIPVPSGSLYPSTGASTYVPAQPLDASSSRYLPVHPSHQQYQTNVPYATPGNAMYPGFSPAGAVASNSQFYSTPGYPQQAAAPRTAYAGAADEFDQLMNASRPAPSNSRRSDLDREVDDLFKL